MRCSFDFFVDNFGVLSTKENLVDESLGEAFLNGPQTSRPTFLPPSARRLSVFALLKKESSYGHDVLLLLLKFLSHAISVNITPINNYLQIHLVQFVYFQNKKKKRLIFPSFSRKIAKRGKFSTPNTQICSAHCPGLVRALQYKITGLNQFFAPN